MKEELNERLKQLKIKNKKDYELLRNIMIVDDWYLKVKLDTFMKILKRLNYSKEQSIDIYVKLVRGFYDEKRKK